MIRPTHGECSRLVLLILLGGLASCARVSKVAGPYELTVFDGHYYLDDSNQADPNRRIGGVLHGDIEQLGWNEEFIVAQVRAGGWRVIDVRSRTMSGVLSEEELRQLQQEKPRVASIKIYSSKEAWRRLGGR